MRIFVPVLRIFTILAVAAISVTAAYAQTDNDDNDSSSRTSCADVKPPAVNPADTISNVPLYLIPSNSSGHQARCRATEALAEGMVDVEFSDDVVLAQALGDPVPDTNIGEVSEFPYSAPGSRPIPGLPPPGPSDQRPEGSHLYAAFVDPNTGVEHTFSSVAQSEADVEAAAVEWISSTVEPLLEHRASPAIALAETNNRFAAAAATGVSTYNQEAWKLLIDATIAMPGQGSEIREFGQKFPRAMGGSGATVRVYRLNGNQAESDYFLVDTAYTQTPSYDPFDFFSFIIHINIFAWANRQTDFTLAGIDPNHSSTIKPTLEDFAPQTKITASTETFTVGANLIGAVGTGSGGGVSGSYSVTRTQESVDTTVKGTRGTGSLQWTDTYNGFGINGIGIGLTAPPSTSTQTFTGERLAIFKVSRTVNDNIPAGKQAGLEFTPNLESHVKGFVLPDRGFREIFAGWNLRALLFAPEPQFSVHYSLNGPPINPDGPPIEVSKSGNPVLVNVVAQLPTNAALVTWGVTEKPDFVNTDVGSAGRTGSANLKIFAAPGAEVGNFGYILVDSFPSRGTDSLRNGPIRIPVKITQ